MRRWWATLLCLWAAVCASGCDRATDTLIIGVKEFAEQAIIAQLGRQLLQSRADIRAQLFECGDTYQCQEALQAGRIDLMIEYTGTAQLFLGIDPGSPAAMPELRRACDDRGLVWRPALGFDNAYRLAVHNRVASQLAIGSITELTNFEGGIRVTCPKSYLRRPGDGLAALLERHGLRLRGEALTLETPDERIDAVLTGRADVAVVYGTDGALRNGGVTLLEDTLGFFPHYEAAWLVRRDSLERFEGLASALELLEGQLSADAVQELNYAVQVEGWKPADVARSFLVSRGLLERSVEARSSRLKLVLALAEADELDQQQTLATRALRRVFADRPVQIRPVPDPAKLVAKGTAKLALIGAERFFSTEGASLRRTTALEAIAVVGSRMVHLLRAGASGTEPGSDPLEGRIGIGPPSSGAGRIGQAVLAASGKSAAQTGTASQLLSQLEEGSLDAALLVDELGSPLLTAALKRQRAHLVALPLLPRDRMPYLRPSRVPAHTYAGQDEPVDTLAAQVVLAGPSRRPLREVLRPGPGSAMLVEALPLPLEEARLLAEATGVPEWPDPVLPVAWVGRGQADEASTSNATLNTVLNALVLLFLAWLAVLVARGARPGARAEEDERA